MAKKSKEIGLAKKKNFVYLCDNTHTETVLPEMV